MHFTFPTLSGVFTKDLTQRIHFMYSVSLLCLRAKTTLSRIYYRQMYRFFNEILLIFTFFNVHNFQMSLQLQFDYAFTFPSSHLHIHQHIFRSNLYSYIWFLRCKLFTYNKYTVENHVCNNILRATFIIRIFKLLWVKFSWVFEVFCWNIPCNRWENDGILMKTGEEERALTEWDQPRIELSNRLKIYHTFCVGPFSWLHKHQFYSLL